MRIPSQPLASIAALLWFGFGLLAAASGLAAAPPVRLETFRTQLAEFFAEHGDDSPVERMRDAQASNQIADLHWQIEELLDRNASLQGLEQFGLVFRPDDRSIHIDYELFPQWVALHERLRGLADRQS